VGSGILGHFYSVFVDHYLKFKKVFDFFLEVSQFDFFLMENSVKVDEFSDSFRVFLELEVNVSDLAGKGLSPFENFLGNRCDEGLVLFFVHFLDFGFEILGFEKDESELNDFLSFFDGFFIDEVVTQVLFESLIFEIVFNRLIEERVDVDCENLFSEELLMRRNFF
jgi:hypothetical protein